MTCNPQPTTTTSSLPTALARIFHPNSAAACESLMQTALDFGLGLSGMSNTALRRNPRPPCLHHAARRLATNRYEISGLAVVGNELAIAWNDGTEQFISLCMLREACPCAVCEGEPDVMGNKISLKKKLTSESFVLKKYEFVGGYGIQFFWGDGHSTGIYSVGYLRRLLTSKP